MGIKFLIVNDFQLGCIKRRKINANIVCIFVSCMPRLQLPRSSYDFRSAISPMIFRHRRSSWATTCVFTIHTDIVRFLALAFVEFYRIFFSFYNIRKVCIIHGHVFVITMCDEA